VLGSRRRHHRSRAVRRCRLQHRRHAVRLTRPRPWGAYPDRLASVVGEELGSQKIGFRIMSGIRTVASLRTSAA
jgi:hypothetical protein